MKKIMYEYTQTRIKRYYIYPHHKKHQYENQIFYNGNDSYSPIGWNILNFFNLKADNAYCYRK